MSPRCSTRIVTIVFLIALEILTIKSNVNAYVIKQDPKRLAAVMAELEQLGGGIGGSKDDVLNDKMIDMKHDGTSQSMVPIETTAKTEEIQKSSTETTTRNDPKSTTLIITESAISTKTEISTTNIPETTTNGKLDTTIINKSHQTTTSGISYTYEHPTTNVPTQTTIDFLLDNTETESNGDTAGTGSTTAKEAEVTETNNTTSYSTEAVRTDTNALSDASSTTDIDDDSPKNMPNMTETTPSTTTLTTPTSQIRENTDISTKSTTSSDILTTDVKPLQKKYIILDRKRNNMMDEEKMHTTKKEIKLATAETKYQNYDSNGATVSTPEWYYVNVKQDISSHIKTDSSAIPYDTNTVNENQAQLTSVVVTDNTENLVSPLSKMKNPSTMEILTEAVTLKQYSSGLTHFIESQSTQDMHVTSEAATETEGPKITTTEFLTTTGISEFSTTTELSTVESKTNQILSTSDVSSLRSPRAYNVTGDSKSTESVRGTNEITIETTKSVLTSKRAGYLNMSSKPTSRSEATTTDKKTPTVTQDATKTSPVTEPIPTTDRKIYMQSQSQLAEDAINEELMKEEMMNDHIGYTQQNREQRKDKDLAKDVTTQKASTTTDDILSVKPIGVDKQKNSSLYTVSPNYKPMKKIEVQPPKPFVRDPDDNSWRNESLSSLGIVFKANNSSKPLTQVLKNKTEMELNSLLDKYGKSGEPELRTRLEKIAEQRKTKKRVGEKSGEISYGDSEEVVNIFSQSYIVTTPEVTTVEVVPSVRPIPKSTAAVSSSSTTEEPDNFVKSTISISDREEPSQTGYLTASPPKKNNYESFDGSDEELDYSSLSNIDIKKTPVKKIEAGRNKIGPIQIPIPPERKATVQYFPPRGTKPTKVNLNDYDYDFKRKIQDLEQDKRVSPLVYSSSTTPVPIKQDFPSTQRQQNVKEFRLTVTDILEQKFTNVFSSETPQIEGQDGFNGASYVIKHLKDFIHLAARESDEDRAAYLTEPSRVPIQSATAHGYLKDNKVKSSDYEDYDRQFRNEVLEKFVENFNQHSERFKVDFPVLYNTSIIHNNFADESKQASSSAFMKRLHGVARARGVGGAGGEVGGAGAEGGEAGETGCERAVELAPEYELHYYVPEQEEREVAHADQLLSPVRYRLRL